MVPLLAAGCSGVVPDTGSTPIDVEPRIVGTSSAGGQCVDAPGIGQVVESTNRDGVQSASIEANVTGPGVHYVINQFRLDGVGAGTLRLAVNTTEDPEKPARECRNGGIVHYQVTIERPAGDGFEREIRHDGSPVSGIGAGGES